MPHNIVGSLLAYDLTLMELKGALFVIGQTHGSKRKWARLSISQWASALRIDRRNVPRLVKNLVTKNLIQKRNSRGAIPECRIQDDSSDWKVRKRPMPELPKWKESAHRVISKEDSDQKTNGISTDDTQGENLPLDELPHCLFCKNRIENSKPFQTLCYGCSRPGGM